MTDDAKFLAEIEGQVDWAGADTDLTVQAARSLRVAFEYAPRLLKMVRERDAQLLKLVGVSSKLVERDAEIVSLKFDLNQKSGEIGRAEHRGNTVDYIYDKLENYSRQLGEVAADAERMRKMVDVARDALYTIRASMCVNNSLTSVTRVYQCSDAAITELDRIAKEGT